MKWRKQENVETFEKRLKRKAFFKKRKAWFIVYGVFLIVGIIAWSIGSVLAGANPIEWLTSAYAITWYCILLVGTLIFGIIMWFFYLKDKGGFGNE